MDEHASEFLRQTGIWAGWLGGVLLNASLVLMVREPLLARMFGGLERMYRWHHRFGMAAYLILLVHPIALVAAAWPTGSSTGWQLISPVTAFPNNALGWIGLGGLMAGLAASFIGRLSYSSWRKSHAVLGPAVLLGYAHAAAYSGVSIGTALLVLPALLSLIWRNLRADGIRAGEPYEVASVASLPDTMEVTLRPLTTPLNVVPGQFVMAAFFDGPDFHGCGEFHPYTVCGVHAHDELVLAIKRLGDCTQHIQSVHRGTAVRLHGPFGTFLQTRGDRRSLWIAGGMGIAPFIAALRAGNVRRQTEFIYSYRSEKDALYLSEVIDQATRQPLLRFHGLELQEDLQPLVSVLQRIEDLPTRDIHVCGPPPMVDAVAKELAARGVPRSQIHYEKLDLRT